MAEKAGGLAVRDLNDARRDCSAVIDSLLHPRAGGVVEIHAEGRKLIPGPLVDIADILADGVIVQHRRRPGRGGGRYARGGRGGRHGCACNLVAAAGKESGDQNKKYEYCADFHGGTSLTLAFPVYGIL
ncbi:hypothetical protein SDC9_111876 [bioreactor metagenome]|uniref:Uncharacterized protein n=1 Tax=bioreactor metagenome TaxID=1076179 RepID=A0A645BT57_9ZZZZ